MHITIPYKCIKMNLLDTEKRAEKRLNLSMIHQVRQRSSQNYIESKQAQQVSDWTGQNNNKKRCTSKNIQESIFNTKWEFAAVHLQFQVMCKHKPVLCLEDWQSSIVRNDKTFPALNIWTVTTHVLRTMHFLYFTASYNHIMYTTMCT